MGGHLAAAAADQWAGKLTKNEYTALLILAISVRDDDPGRRVPVIEPRRGEPETVITRRLGLSRSSRYVAIRGLVERGAITRAEAGRRGTHAEYTLGPWAADSIPATGTHSIPATGTHSIPATGTPRRHKQETQSGNSLSARARDVASVLAREGDREFSEREIATITERLGLRGKRKPGAYLRTVVRNDSGGDLTGLVAELLDAECGCDGMAVGCRPPCPVHEPDEYARDAAEQDAYT